MRTVACAVVLLCASSAATAQDQWVGGRYRLWNATFEGEFSASDSGVNGTDVDIDSDLGIDQSERINNVGLWVSIPFIGRITFDHWTGTFEGEGQLNRSITFAGQTFTVGNTVTSSFDWTVTSIAYEYDFRLPFVPIIDLRVGPRLGAKAILLEAQVDDPLSGFSESADLKGGFPTLGFAAEFYIADYASVAVEVDGLIIPDVAGGVSGRAYDATIVARGGWGGFFVGVGFRKLSFTLKDDRTNVEKAEADMTISGAFFEVGFRY